MKMSMERSQIRLIPEDEVDLAYIEDTLGPDLAVVRQIDLLHGLELAIIPVEPKEEADDTGTGELSREDEEELD